MKIEKMDKEQDAEDQEQILYERLPIMMDN